MKINIYDFIEDMERNIADLYGRLKSLNSFEVIDYFKIQE